ncbi:hypothetical protein [Granulicella sibirica]|uniref:hypothetical protein n=1 Tax=Granulicella sibirica TaxID=2479048 RepID=UPI001F4F9C3D|nr:hypothetical protein [Granulicella sibirica]
MNPLVLCQACLQRGVAIRQFMAEVSYFLLQRCVGSLQASRRRDELGEGVCQEKYLGLTGAGRGIYWLEMRERLHLQLQDAS